MTPAGSSFATAGLLRALEGVHRARLWIRLLRYQYWLAVFGTLLFGYEEAWPLAIVMGLSMPVGLWLRAGWIASLAFWTESEAYYRGLLA